MRIIGRIFGRLFAVSFAYVIACVAAGLAVAGGIVLRGFIDDSIRISYQRLFGETMFATGLTASFAAVYAFAPAVVVIVIAEAFRIRRGAYYVIGGGLVGGLAYVASLGFDITGRSGPMVVPELGPHFVLYVAAGIVGGFVYWGFAGRSAGVTDSAPA